MRWIDTHTHLDDDQFAADQTAVIDDADRLGVDRFVNIGYGPERWTSTLDLATRVPGIRYALGLHPVDTDAWSPETLDALQSVVEANRPVAIGEIGLDYYWRDDNKTAQAESFIAQISLARIANLPIVIHQRGSAADVLKILDGHARDVSVVLHSFDGDPDLARVALDRGWTLGVGGLSTRRQNEGLRELLKTFPLEQIVLETDSPYLVPSGLKARRNTPSSIPLIGERLANLRSEPIERIAEQTTHNAIRLFQLEQE